MFIDGNQILENGEFIHIDEKKLIAQTQEKGKEILRAAYSE